MKNNQKKKYTKNDYKKDLNNLNKLVEKFKNRGEKKYRNFSVFSINDKELKNKVGKYKITAINNKGDKSKANPIDAAYKAAISLIRKNEKSMLENKEKTTISIIEITRGSDRKVYGPYEIIIKKLSKEEFKKKKEEFKKKKKSFKSKPINFNPKKYNVNIKPIYDK